MLDILYFIIQFNFIIFIFMGFINNIHFCSDFINSLSDIINFRKDEKAESFDS